MNILLTLGIFLAGGSGAYCRYSLGEIIKKHWQSRTPLGTLTINLLGSLALGLVTGALAARLGTFLGQDATRAASLILGTGFLGGFTTFSTAMLEVVQQVKEKRASSALALLFLQALACLVLALTGLIITL